ncbi:transcriptional regulator [Arthrobacter livingstonensis]|uniref:Transcriptional regulator n=2 Tax=Arthrobacter livingstonensis TaxID=670078 RepID=A0A2V5L363_9MICC|nr:transcriptional regulator [Arthrobacter livingstonensis]
MQGVMRTTQDLGLMVHGVRTRHQLTQAELATRLGVSQRYLSELETGKPKVLNAKLLSVLDQLGVELIYREVQE